MRVLQRASLVLLFVPTLTLSAQESYEQRIARMRLLPSPTSIAFVHGLLSSPATWDSLSRLMDNMGDDDRWKLIFPKLIPAAHFSTNADSLVRIIDNEGLSSPLLVGHSMGGIVSRLAARQRVVRGVISVGTPHLGANLATSLTNDFWDSPWKQFSAAAGVGCIAAYSLPTSYDIDSWYITDWEIDLLNHNAQQSCEDLLLLGVPYAYQLLEPVLSAFAGFNINDAIVDLAHNSYAIATLQAYETTEFGSIRESFKMDMAYGYLGGAYALREHDMADLYGQNLLDNGARTFFNAMDFGMAMQAEGFYEYEAQALGVMALGLLEMNYWWIWGYDIVGGIPSDGVVPWGSQQMPRTSVVHTGSGFLHTEETVAFRFRIRDRLTEVLPP